MCTASCIRLLNQNRPLKTTCNFYYYSEIKILKKFRTLARIVEFVCGTYGVPHFRSPMISVRKRETKSIGEMVGPTPKMTKEADVHFVLDHLDHQGFVWNNYKCASLLLLFPFLFFFLLLSISTQFFGGNDQTPSKWFHFISTFAPKKNFFSMIEYQIFSMAKISNVLLFKKKKLFHGVWLIT